MAKRAGLHKEIAAIFGENPVRQRADSQRDDSGNKPVHTGQTAAGPATRTKPVPKTNPMPEQKPAPQPSTIKQYMTEQESNPRPQFVKPQPQKQQVKQQPIKPQPKLQPAKPQLKMQPTLQRIKDRYFAPKPGISAKRQVTMAVLTPVLGFVMIIMLLKAFGKPAPDTAESHGMAPAKAAVAVDIESVYPIPESYPENLRDPMEFGSVTVMRQRQFGTGDFAIAGTILSDDNPAVIIGGKILHEGDIIDGVTVVKISHSNVVFEKEDEQWMQQVER